VETHESELKAVQEHVKQARKLLVSAPKEHREVWERELSGLELAKKRAESAVNQDRRERGEQEALSRLSKEEREKRKNGKSRWWMKKCAWQIFIHCVSL
jgi:ribosomal RNA-processing protein 36